MNIMFMGTPEFACASLRALCEKYGVASVVTSEDKPRGRGHKMTACDVCKEAQSLGIEHIYKLPNLKRETFEKILNAEKPDLIAVVAYGKLLPEYVINYPKYGCINVHGSLLPKYRGAAPMQWCLIDGESETGVTTMYMDKGLDTGDMLLKESIPLTDDDNFGTVHDRLSAIGAKLLVKTIDKISEGSIERVPQGETTTHYASMIDKEMTVIDWTRSAREILNLVRGLTPFPKASSTLGGKGVKILRTSVSDKRTDAKCGEVISVGGKSFDVACGGGTVLTVCEIQPETKKAMTVEDYLKGNELAVGTILK